MQYTKRELDKAAAMSKQHLDNLVIILKKYKMTDHYFFNTYKEKVGVVLSHHKELDNSLIVYRARKNENISAKDVISTDSFSYFPIDKANDEKPALGRLNIRGQSIFYASFSPETNFSEIDKSIKSGTEIFLSRWQIKDKINCYNLLLPNNVYDGKAKSDELVLTDTEIVNSNLGNYIKRIGEVCLESEFKDDRKYFISSLFANIVFDIKNENEKSVYDGILYPSAVIGNGKSKYTNLAVTSKCADEKLSAQWVIKGKLMDDLKTIRPLYYGMVNEKKVNWFKLVYHEIFSPPRIIGLFDDIHEYIFEQCEMNDKDWNEIKKFCFNLNKNAGKEILIRMIKDLEGGKIAFNYEDLTNVIEKKKFIELTYKLCFEEEYLEKYKLSFYGKKFVKGGVVVASRININTLPVEPEEVIRNSENIELKAENISL